VKIRGNQERAGATIAIARGDVACPAKALREWLDAGGIVSGPIFRPIDKGRHRAMAMISRASCWYELIQCAAIRGLFARVIATSADTRRLAVFFPPHEEQTNQQASNDSVT
jgi:hypothetical protein